MKPRIRYVSTIRLLEYMLLSIIIPVYNIEKYIGACVSSVLDQDIDASNYEILIIDDGSKDGSSEIIKEFERNHKNILVHRQKNVGLGGARKSGIKLAKGKYIYFLDGDDYLAKNTLNAIMQCMEANDLDILGFDTITTEKLDLAESRYKTIPEKIEITDGISFIGTNENYRIEVWWYILNRQFLIESNIIFEDKRFVNDSYFTPSIFLKAKKVAHVPIDIYRYVQRPNSITSNKSLSHYRKHIGDLEYAIFQMEGIMNGIKEHPLKEDAIHTITVKQESYAFFSMIRFLESDLELSYLKELISKYQNLGIYPMMKLTTAKKYKGLKYKLIASLFNNGFSLYPTVHIMRGFFRLKRLLF